MAIKELCDWCDSAPAYRSASIGRSLVLACYFHHPAYLMVLQRERVLSHRLQPVPDPCERVGHGNLNCTHPEPGSQVCPHADCGYGECSGRWVNGACETHGNGEGRCQQVRS